MSSKLQKLYYLIRVEMLKKFVKGIYKIAQFVTQEKRSTRLQQIAST